MVVSLYDSLLYRTSPRGKRSFNKFTKLRPLVSKSPFSMLIVSWDEDGEDYTERRLRAFFSRFGEVEEMLFKNRGPAEIVMATKDAAVKGFQHDCAVHEKFEGKKQQ
ncbi:hypothetical protein ACFX15_005805 [Malus domestica]